MPKLGLIGKDISYSFSKAYFTTKFENEELPFFYENFDIKDISQFKNILKNNPDLLGLNVTIPYKEQIIPYLDGLRKKSIKPFLKPHHKKALILGTGGASKAIAYTLERLNIQFDYVSRTSNKKAKFTYDDLNETIISSYPIIINCTPIGTHPKVNECPNIPYDGITKDHLLFDLIYNPIQTKFLICGEIKGATTCNGYSMLEFQAEKAWKIWGKG
mgnify:CR=1 FL=1